MLHRIALRVLPSLSTAVTAPDVRRRKRLVMVVPGFIASLVYLALKRADVLSSLPVVLSACGLLATLTALIAFRIGRAVPFAAVLQDQRSRLPWLLGWIGLAYGIQLALLVFAILKLVHYDYAEHPAGPAMMALIIAVTSVARDAFEIGHLRRLEAAGRPLPTFPDGSLLRSVLAMSWRPVLIWSMAAAAAGAVVAGIAVQLAAPDSLSVISLALVSVLGGASMLFAYVNFSGRKLSSISSGSLFRFWWWPGAAFAATYALVGIGAVTYLLGSAMTGTLFIALSAIVCGLLTAYAAALGVRRVAEDRIRESVPQTMLRCPFVNDMLTKVWSSRASSTGVATMVLLSVLTLSVPALAADSLPDTGVAEDIYYHTPGVPSGPPAPDMSHQSYPRYGSIDSRLLVWFVTQQHTYFGGFVLSLPIFCVLIEFLGLTARDRARGARYDQLARDVIRVALLAFSVTAIVGSIMLALFISLYPSFMQYMGGTFKSMMPVYAGVFLAESILLIAYYYSWDRLASGAAKWLHASVGVVANLFGAALLFLANGWIAFMMSPSGVDADGRYLGNVWHLLHSALWNPLNVHRFLADIMSGGAVILAYAAYRFFTSRSQEERAYYDWVGCVFLFVTVCALLPMPFAGYWLMRSVYAFRQSMGVTMMGGLLTWLFVVQAVLIGVLFLGINYYLWQSLMRLPEGQRYQMPLKWLVVGLMACVLVWLTPHTLLLSASELKAMGGAQHPVIGYYGVMSAKNGAINTMICLTALSYILYRRANRVITVRWARGGNLALAVLFGAGLLNIIWLAVYGFYVPASVRVGLSSPQAWTTFTVLAVGLLLNRAMLRGAAIRGPVQWGQITGRGMITLFVIAASFTWVMGLMGYIRSSGRLSWHVSEIMPDVSPWAYTPAFGFAAKMVTLNMAVFWLTVLALFWLSGRGEDRTQTAGAHWRLWPQTSLPNAQAKPSGALLSVSREVRS
ncbi:MAG TPA: cytochrome ubiquinol oxidase subunit I [Nitrospirales bacterium]|nr:cytochrome ubiquinol oxidase subunit I [Nitrospirales bacterium]